MTARTIERLAIAFLAVVAIPTAGKLPATSPPLRFVIAVIVAVLVSL